MESVMKSISGNKFMIRTCQNPIGNMSAICWESGTPHRLNQWRPYTFWGDDLRFHLILIENKSVDIKFSVHDAFLELPSSGTVKVERLENKIILKFLEAIQHRS